ncbi:MAG: hypothetical protein WAX77_14205 [Methylococcaceae bacterium]
MKQVILSIIASYIFWIVVLFFISPMSAGFSLFIPPLIFFFIGIMIKTYTVIFSICIFSGLITVSIFYYFFFKKEEWLIVNILAINFFLLLGMLLGGELVRLTVLLYTFIQQPNCLESTSFTASLAQLEDNHQAHIGYMKNNKAFLWSYKKFSYVEIDPKDNAACNH